MNDVTFQRLLQSVLFDNKYDRYVQNRKSGKLNTRKISKISYSDKLFKKKEERKNKNYSIALVVDCSGSMSGTKAKLAFEAAQKLSKHLSSAGVNHCVYAFNTCTVALKNWNSGYDNQIENKLHKFLNYGRGYFDRYLNFIGHSYTGWTGRFEKLKEVKRTSDVWSSDGAGYNNDTHALRYAAKELKKQPGTRIMIVLSDGSPASSAPYQSAEFPKEKYGGCYQNLKKVVSGIIKNGVELHSIGIMTDEVNNYYPPERTCPVHDLKQIYDHIIKIIKLNLKRG